MALQLKKSNLTEIINNNVDSSQIEEKKTTMAALKEVEKKNQEFENEKPSNKISIPFKSGKEKGVKVCFYMKPSIIKKIKSFSKGNNMSTSELLEFLVNSIESGK